MMPIRVLVADDHELIRKTLSQVLGADPEIEVLAVAVNLAQAIALCNELHPDVVVMDLHMGDERHVTPQQVRSCFSRSRLLGISIWNDEETKSLAESFGALVLLDKTTLGADLIPTIKLCAKLPIQGPF
jgi:DNA-binding NarL/FixJ family response regulator